MSKKKSVVVSAMVTSETEYSFHFEYKGDVNNEDAMIDAAWKAFHGGKTLGEPILCSDDENGMEICGVEDGSPDDYRARPPSKAKLWREMSAQLGILMHHNGDEVTVAHIKMEVENRRKDTKVIREMKSKVRELLAAWEAAE